jgi:hypothetical protein
MQRRRYLDILSRSSDNKIIQDSHAALDAALAREEVLRHELTRLTAELKDALTRLQFTQEALVSARNWVEDLSGELGDLRSQLRDRPRIDDSED